MRKMTRRIDAGVVVWMVFAAALVYCVSAWAYPVFFMKELEPPRIEQVALAPQEKVSSARTPLSEYEQALSGRAIFEVLLVEAQLGPGAKTLAEVLRETPLVGIVSGKQPQAVFDDTAHQITLYAREGDNVGPLVVEKIEDGVVTVSYGGEFVELQI